MKGAMARPRAKALRALCNLLFRTVLGLLLSVI